MVFNIVACYIKDKPEAELDRLVKGSCGQGNKAIAEVYDVNVRDLRV
jgi:hypothetical protein